MTDNQYLLQNYNCEWLDYMLPIIFAGIAIYLIYKAYKSWQQGSYYRDEINKLLKH